MYVIFDIFYYWQSLSCKKSMKSIEMCRTEILTYTLLCGFIVVVGLRPICLLPRGQRPPKYKYTIIHSTEPLVASSISKRIAS